MTPRTDRRRSTGQRGFTLLEVMVALAITGAIAAMAYQGLTAASNGAERSREIVGQINRIDRAWQLLGTDFRHLMAPVSGPDGISYRFEADPMGSLESETRVMRLTRYAWANPLERLRSDLQRVEYRLEEGTLWRYYRPVRNMRYDSYEFEEEAVKVRLLRGVEELEMRFLSQAEVARRGESALEGDEYTRDWARAWPDPDQVGGGGRELPLAVLMRIDVEGVGVSERLFEITAQ